MNRITDVPKTLTRHPPVFLVGTEVWMIKSYWKDGFIYRRWKLLGTRGTVRLHIPTN